MLLRSLRSATAQRMRRLSSAPSEPDVLIVGSGNAALCAGIAALGRVHCPNYGNLSLPHVERKNYRKICYFLGVLINDRGQRFVDEGRHFRNYTYAQFGAEILRQPGGRAWQLFDSKVRPAPPRTLPGPRG